MQLRLMLFDLWGTLIVDAPGVAIARERLRVERAAETLRTLGFDYETAGIATAFKQADAEHGRIHTEGLDISARGRTVLYLRHLDESLGECIDEEGWHALDDAVLTQALKLPPAAFTGAAQALDDVKALGLPIGLVSNAGTTPGFVLREILDRLGLLVYFDATIFSDEVEVAKPAPAIFERALEEFGCPPEAAAFVGDQPVLDVLGSRSAGIWSVQFGSIESDGIEPHARIDDLADLLPALRSLRLIG
jgi:putative hydrolase of the HAD superfamily